MNILLFCSLLLFSAFPPGVESEFFDKISPTKWAKTLILELGFDGNKEMEAEVSAFVDEAKDLFAKDILKLGVLIELQEKLNALFRKGGIVKKISLQDLLNEAREEIMDKLEDLEAHVKLVYNANNSNSYNRSLDNFLAITKGPSLNVIAMAVSLSRMASAGPGNILKLATEDAPCTEKTLRNAQRIVKNLLNRLILVEAFNAKVIGKSEIDAHEGLEPIRTVVSEAMSNSDQYIENFKINSTCWSQHRIESTILKVIGREEKVNITKRAIILTKILSQWHTIDKFVVIARENSGCDKGCTFQEAVRLRRKNNIVSYHNITIIRTRAAVNDLPRSELKVVIENTKKMWRNFTCINDADYFLKTLTMMDFVATIKVEECTTAIRSTDPNSMIVMDLVFDRITGKATKILTGGVPEIAGEISNRNANYQAKAVFTLNCGITTIGDLEFNTCNV